MLFLFLFFEIYWRSREPYRSINSAQPQYGLHNTKTPLRTPDVDIYSDFIIGHAKLSLDQRTLDIFLPNITIEREEGCYVIIHLLTSMAYLEANLLVFQRQNIFASVCELLSVSRLDIMD